MAFAIVHPIPSASRPFDLGEDRRTS